METLMTFLIIILGATVVGSIIAILIQTVYVMMKYGTSFGLAFWYTCRTFNLFQSHDDETTDKN